MDNTATIRDNSGGGQRHEFGLSAFAEATLFGDWSVAGVGLTFPEAARSSETSAPATRANGSGYFWNRKEQKMHGSSSRVALCCFLIVCLDLLPQAQPLHAQGGRQGVNPVNASARPVANSRRGETGASANLGVPAQGGAAQADFDSLIDLIQSTVAYDTWAENGSGEGEISPFAINGVYADAKGTLRFGETLKNVASLKRAPVAEAGKNQSNARANSPLRYVSLPRLERAILRCQHDHHPLDEAMLTLAGLEKLEYVIVSPRTGDLILAGPAGDWQRVDPGVLVSKETGHPVLRLDDLLSLWRRPSGNVAFGCSIVPRQEALAQTQDYLRQTGAQPVDSRERKQWLTGLRDSLGRQDVEFFGIVPENHVAAVLLLADYHMKLIGMGLVDGVDGVQSYLESVKLLPDGTAPPMSVLRWWFAMRSCEVSADAQHEVFQLPTDLVQVLSENELLAARGERIHTNQSDELNRKFARSFTGHFQQIGAVYPLYGELQNVFSLGLALALLEREDLVHRSTWKPSLLLDAERLPLPVFRIPRTVETVVNHRVIHGRHIIAGISGGVWIDTKTTMQLHQVNQNVLGRGRNMPLMPADERWWWD